MSITTKTLKHSKHACGFCTTGGRHDLCPGGVLNGNGTEIVLCACDKHPQPTRCLECGLRGDEVNPDTWACLDQDGCQARRAIRREKTFRDLYGASETGEPLRAVPVKEKAPKAPPKAKTGNCLHCDAPTKGGMFAPGHDAAFLSIAAKLILDPESERTLAETTEAWRAWGISEALIAKLAKRVS